MVPVRRDPRRLKMMKGQDLTYIVIAAKGT